MLDIVGKEKPDYNEGEKVTFSVHHTDWRGTGYIRGKISSDLIDYWIVEIINCVGTDYEKYKFSCISLPHTVLESI